MKKDVLQLANSIAHETQSVGIAIKKAQAGTLNTAVGALLPLNQQTQHLLRTECRAKTGIAIQGTRSGQVDIMARGADID